MKYIILFLSLNLFAAPFVSRQHIQDWHNKVNRVYTSYGTERECLSSHNECYDLKGRDINVMDIKQVELDDPSKAKYAAKTNATACSVHAEYINSETGQPRGDDCRLLISYESQEGQEPIPSLCTDKTYYPVYVEKEGGYEAYCTKLLGYEKMIKEDLVEDAVKVAAVAAAKAALEQEEAQKQQEKEAAQTYVDANKDSISTMNTEAMAELLQNMLKLIETK